MNNLKKGAIICALVMMISIVPAFALNNTNNTTTDQNSTTTNTAGEHQYGQNTDGSNGNCGTCDGSCDGDQHKYQYGQKNGANGSGNCDQAHKYQYGQNNANAGTENCDGQNCKNTS